jgi:Protein of unknown function (DUF3987)
MRAEQGDGPQQRYNKARAQRREKWRSSDAAIGAEAAPDAVPEWVFDPWEPYIVPTFPLTVLPETARTFVENQAAVTGGDISGIAMAVLATMSGALDHRCQLRMLRNGNWWVSPRLWVLLVADASQRKTPIMTATTRPLVAQDYRVQQEYQRQLREWEQRQRDKEEDGGGTKLDKPEPPARYVVTDTAVEKLGEILARKAKGILLKADEVSGWLGSMERYSSNAGLSDRAFWLQAYDGGPYNIDRIRRGEIFVENLSVSIIGAIQPARLVELQKVTSDGLLQRFLPVMMGSPSLPQDERSNDDDYGNLVRQLYIAAPARLIMTDSALGIMERLRTRLFDIEQAAIGLAPGLGTFAGKLHGVAGSLALLLHVTADPKQAMADPVGEETATQVERLINGFVLPHACEFYRFGPAGEQLRTIASWILTSGRTRILPSDLTT